MTARAFADVIASGRYSHRSFIAGVDAALARAGCVPDASVRPDREIGRRLRRGLWRRRLRARGRVLKDAEFPGRHTLRTLLGR